MDNFTQKTSFGQWFSPINLQSYEGNAKTNYTKLMMPLEIIDSSTLPLNLTNRMRNSGKTKAGVKLHLRLVFLEKGTLFSVEIKEKCGHS